MKTLNDKTKEELLEVIDQFARGISYSVNLFCTFVMMAESRKETGRRKAYVACLHTFADIIGPFAEYEESKIPGLRMMISEEYDQSENDRPVSLKVTYLETFLSMIDQLDAESCDCAMCKEREQEYVGYS